METLYSLKCLCLRVSAKTNYYLLSQYRIIVSYMYFQWAAENRSDGDIPRGKISRYENEGLIID